MDPAFEAAVPVAARVAEAARNEGVPVLHADVVFEPGFPEIDRANTFYAENKTGDYMVAGTDGAHWDARICRDGEWTIPRCRIGVFTSSRAAEMMRGLNVRTLIVCGIATSGVVLSTVRQAADLDFRLIVVADACADRDAEVHRVLTEKVFPTQAEVVSADSVIRDLR